MTNTEIEKYIHEQVMGLCIHDWESDGANIHIPTAKCLKCRTPILNCASIPAYTQSLDAVRPAEEKFVAERGYGRLQRELERIVLADNPDLPVNNQYLTFLMAHATAEQRSRAVVAAHLEG